MLSLLNSHADSKIGNKSSMFIYIVDLFEIFILFSGIINSQVNEAIEYEILLSYLLNPNLSLIIKLFLFIMKVEL